MRPINIENNERNVETNNNNAKKDILLLITRA